MLLICQVVIVPTTARPTCMMHNKSSAVAEKRRQPLRSLCSTVITATSYSYGEWQNRRYRNFKTPGISDYVGDMTQHAKIQTDRSDPLRPSRQMGEISLDSRVVFRFLSVTPIFSRVPRLNWRTDFYAVWLIGCQSQLFHIFISPE